MSNTTYVNFLVIDMFNIEIELMYLFLTYQSPSKVSYLI